MKHATAGTFWRATVLCFVMIQVLHLLAPGTTPWRWHWFYVTFLIPLTLSASAAVAARDEIGFGARFISGMIQGAWLPEIFTSNRTWASGDPYGVTIWWVAFVLVIALAFAVVTGCVGFLLGERAKTWDDRYCRTCDYDLTGNVSGICPECGTPIRRSERFHGGRVSSVLVLHAGALGDCVLALHLVDALRRAWGGARITMAARSPIVRWAKRHGLVDEALSLEDLSAHLWYHPDAELSRESIRVLRGSECVVSFLGGVDDVVSSRLSALCTGQVLSIDPKPTMEPPVSQMHITRQWAVQLAERGVSIPVGTIAETSVPDEVRVDLHERLVQRLDGKTGRIAICHPGSGGLRKCCGLDTLEELVVALQSRGWSVCWMVGPDEMERDGPSLIGRLESKAPVILEDSVDQAADLAAGADAYIGHDAGMTHVAALAGVPTIAVFGPTDSDVWRPLGKRCAIVPFPRTDEPVVSWIAKVVSLTEST